MKINLVNDYDHMDERFHMDAFENTNAVCNMDEVFKTWLKGTIIHVV